MCLNFQIENISVFQHIVELLLDIVCQSNQPSDRHIRGTACQCLEQIETLCPASFESSINYTKMKQLVFKILF